MFRDKLAAVADANQSLLCLGLDPYEVNPRLVADFNRAIIEETSDLVCAYKPNLSIYDEMGFEGTKALQATLERIPSHIPVIGDHKRADIENCGKALASLSFARYGLDAVTVPPYMGGDAIAPFIHDTWSDRYVFILCLTSNPSSGDFQTLQCTGRDGIERPLFLEVARMAALKWNQHGNVGFVVGATFPGGLEAVRKEHPQAILLVPGVGVQGGSVREAVLRAADEQGKGFVLSVSRSITFANGAPSDVTARTLKSFATAARAAAARYREEINDALARSLVAS
jgi:orotidine-5'-phosphate decarboxylase